MFRSLGALIGDVLAVLVFVVVGLLQHDQQLSSMNLFLVGWPFLVGLLVGHLAIRAWNAPFRIWPHGVFIWAITIVAAMAIRTLFSAGTELSFVIVTASVIGALMLGWRAVASYLTRGERVEVLAARRSSPEEPGEVIGERTGAVTVDDAESDPAKDAEPTDADGRPAGR